MSRPASVRRVFTGAWEAAVFSRRTSQVPSLSQARQRMSPPSSWKTAASMSPSRPASEKYSSSSGSSSPGARPSRRSPSDQSRACSVPG